MTLKTKKYLGFEKLWTPPAIFIAHYKYQTNTIFLYNSTYYTPVSNVPIKFFVSLTEAQQCDLSPGDYVTIMQFNTKIIEKLHTKVKEIPMSTPSKWSNLPSKLGNIFFAHSDCRLIGKTIVSERLSFDNDIGLILDVVSLQWLSKGNKQ